jgi:hypothetical protein
LRGKIFSNIINNITDTRRITQVIPIDTEDGRLSVALVLIRKNNDVFRWSMLSIEWRLFNLSWSSFWLITVDELVQIHLEHSIGCTLTPVRNKVNIVHYDNCKTGLKISKGVVKAVNRRTDNTMSILSTKCTEKIEEQEPNWKPGRNFGRVSISCSTSGTSRKTQIFRNG